MATSLITERTKLLIQINELTDRPLLYLSFVWLGITIFELASGDNRILELISYIIWALFIADFLASLLIEKKKAQ